MRVNPLKILLILSIVCLHLAAVSSQATQRPKTWTRAPSAAPAPPSAAPSAAPAPPSAAPAPPAAPLPTVTITRLGVGGPVTGGQNSFGLVELSESAPAAGVTIQLSSDNPAIVVPATVTVAPGASDQSFPVTTVPVSAATTVTVSAKVGATAAPQTATVTVVPPSLSMVICDPQTVPAGTSTTCNVQLNAPVATPSLGPEGDSRAQRGPAQLALTIQLASSDTSVASVPPTVQIGAGQRSQSFTVTTKPLAQSASASISASYGGAAKGTNVHVRPVSLQQFSCSNYSAGTSTECEHIPEYAASYGAGVWTSVMGTVRLTAPAPAGGLVVKLSDSPNLVQFWKDRPAQQGSVLVQVNDIRVPEGQSHESFEIRPRAVALDTRVTVTASAPLTGETRTLVVIVKAPALNTLIFENSGNPAAISGVPVGGRKVRMRVRLIGVAPSDGWPLDLKYTGSTDITGPARVTVPALSNSKGFDVTVGPCSVNPPCTVQVKTGSHTAELTVKP